jgi:tRNA(Ile)-lysidine synthase
MTPLAARTLDAVRRYALLRDGRRVLVALSGGADSVSMLFLLRELEAAGDLALAGVGHLNHQLRGAAADEDEVFCAALAARLGLPFRSSRVDVGGLARDTGRSIEDAARGARYTFLAAAAAELGADLVAVGHTRDDQAETFLLRLVRGAGARGLSGIRPRAGRVIRPLLDVRREDLRAYLRDRGERFREDTSNADVTIPRNRVRHELLPYLEKDFSPGIVDVLARESALARHDEEFLNQQAIDLTARIVLTDEAGTVRIARRTLRDAPKALALRVALGVLERQAAGRAVGFQHAERLLQLADDGPDTSVSLPGQQAARSGDGIVVRACPPKPRSGEDGNGFAFSLSIPGEVQLAPQRVTVCAEKLPGPAARLRQWKGRESEVGVAPDAVQLPLAVRSRRPGDRFRPLGAPGVRKLQDFLVDRKVPRVERDTLPLVVDGNDRIVWVVGQSVAEDFRVTDPSRGVLLLKVKRLGGPG